MSNNKEEMNVVFDYLSTVNSGMLGLADLLHNGKHDRIGSLVKIIAMQSDETVGHLKRICDEQE